VALHLKYLAKEKLQKIREFAGGQWAPRCNLAEVAKEKSRRPSTNSGSEA
jgi:hypothetical protein